MFQATPQESPGIFLGGQQKASSVNAGVAQVGESTSFIFEYGPREPLGASQEPTYDTAKPPGNLDPGLPNGAFLPPPVIVSIGKGSPALQAHQVFEGTITRVSQGHFSAILRDKTNPRNADESVEFENSEVSPEDGELLSPGSVFYWIIGKERTIGGQVKNVSIVQFRRVPPWTASVIAKAAQRAQEFVGLFQRGEDATDAA